MQLDIYYNALAHLGNAIKLKHWFFHVDYDIGNMDIEWGHYQNNIHTIPLTDVIHIAELDTIYSQFKPYIINANIRKMDMGGYIHQQSTATRNFMLYLFFGDVFLDTTFIIIDGEVIPIERNVLYFLNTKMRNSIHTFVNNVYFLELELMVNADSSNLLLGLLNIV